MKRYKISKDCGIGWKSSRIGLQAVKRTSYSEAKRYYEEGLEGLRGVGYQSGVTTALINLGRVAFQLGDYKTSAATFAESLALACELDYPHNISQSLIGAASILTRQHHPETAVKLLAAADAIRRSIGIIMDMSDAPDYEQTRSELQQQIGQGLFAYYWQVGSTLTVAEASSLVHKFYTSGCH